jgi:hypothetical protein
MKHSILHAFHEMHIQTDDYVKQALDQFLSSGEMQRMISEETHRAIRDAVKQETQNYWYNGEGRKVICQAVSDRMQEEISTGERES